MFLKSYKSMYIDSINRKNNYHLSIVKDDLGITEYYVIKYSILPENITSLSFSSSFNEPLEASQLPPHLKCLKLHLTYLEHGIRPGVLPITLESLYLSGSLVHPLEPGVLPSSLKYLSFESDHILKVGSLPPNLEEFTFGRIDSSRKPSRVDDGVLPLTLRKLTAPVSWLPSIKSLSNLKSLTLQDADKDKIDLSYLPCSLTELNILSGGQLISTMPPTIRYLDLIDTPFDTDEIFIDRSQYHFEYLSVNESKVESLQEFFLDTQTLPITLQELEIDDYYKNDRDIILNSNDFPSSLQSLKIPSLVLPQPRIPNNLLLTPLQSYFKKIWLRRLGNHHYLFFNEEQNFLSAIVHESDISNIFHFCKSTHSLPSYNKTE
ncbi:hypothetical protein PPL_06557 [Heterostelium album PN500]|uniref:Uncharacterized protein n=1 Tax=Heterostelium pallidum (strain ATCC 26659 / Pp 5 / PN500) TaxID=670386 RepID=D3BDH4_HETP5|nr:hypothetical protein PPL_06557 [Heterostelium album PN500]EFA80618.1 hypothetical protein PPL_06557 [Heterostelium album PN500]|eukprot:XP_020432738.1 hypothetical protein PPL_06557 [Heterostelium album PN500]